MSFHLATYEQLRTELFRVIPELETRFRAEFGDTFDFTSEDETPGIYLLFEDIVFHFIQENAGEEDKEQQIKSLFEFFEKMACSGDRPIQDLLGIAISEKLAVEPEMLQKFEPFIGPKMQEILNSDIERYEAVKARKQQAV